MKSNPFMILLLFLGMTLAFAPQPACASESSETPSIVFRKLDGEETGLAAGMKAWHDQELKAQGGKFASHGWWPWGLTAFDYDSDGDMDLLPAHHGRPGGRIFKSQFAETGKHTYVDASAELGLAPRSLPGADKKPEVWDFDGDGWLDIAGFSDEAKPSSLFNKEGKTFEKIADFSFHPISHPGPVSDLNGDGYPDLKAHHRGTVYEALYDPEARTFKKVPHKHKVTAKVPQDFLDHVAELQAKVNDKGQKVNRFMGMSYLTDYDLNGDGRNDLIGAGAGAYGAQIIQRYFLADEQGNFIDKTKDMGLPEIGTPIHIEDLNDDGAIDLLIAVGEKAGVYLNDGKGHFKFVDGPMSAFLAKRGPYLHKAFPYDFDNDGDLDLVLTNPRLGQEEIFENIGEGRYLSVLKAGGWDSEPIAVCDLNGDGLLDVCIGGPSKTTITIYLNESKTGHNWCAICPRMEKPNPFAVGATVEVFKAGTLGSDAPQLLRSGKAHKDGTPVHAGLGKADTFDLRVTFPGKEPKQVEWKAVTGRQRIKVMPDGSLHPAK